MWMEHSESQFTTLVFSSSLTGSISKPSIQLELRSAVPQGQLPDHLSNLTSIEEYCRRYSCNFLPSSHRRSLRISIRISIHLPFDSHFEKSHIHYRTRYIALDLHNVRIEHIRAKEFRTHPKTTSHRPPHIQLITDIHQSVIQLEASTWLRIQGGSGSVANLTA